MSENKTTASIPADADELVERLEEEGFLRAREKQELHGGDERWLNDRIQKDLCTKAASALLSLSAELETVKGERDEARRSNREARAIISATHKRAVTHQNCQRHSCPICEGGLFQCADCGAAEIETEQRVCTGPAAEAKLAGGEVVKVGEWKRDFEAWIKERPNHVSLYEAYHAGRSALAAKHRGGES